jgi:hypothetical protein
MSAGLPSDLNERIEAVGQALESYRDSGRPPETATADIVFAEPADLPTYIRGTPRQTARMPAPVPAAPRSIRTAAPEPATHRNLESSVNELLEWFQNRAEDARLHARYIDLLLAELEALPTGAEGRTLADAVAAHELRIVAGNRIARLLDDGPTRPPAVVILTTAGPSFGEVATATTADDLPQLSRGRVALVPGTVTAELLALWMGSARVQQALAQHTAGSTTRSMSRSDVLALPADYPPEPARTKILAIHRTLSELCNLTTEADQHMTGLTDTVISALFAPRPHVENGRP